MVEESGTSMTGDMSSRESDMEISLLKDRKPILAEEMVAKPKIFRADTPLRNLKKEHFESTFVSLGLLGRNPSNYFENVTREKDSLKVDVLIAFLIDIGKEPEDWVEISKEVVHDPIAMRRLYDQRFCQNFSREIIQSALALDAIFVTCFLLCKFVKAKEVHFLKTIDELLTRESRITRDGLYNDIFKMENQIPLVLIRNVIAIIIQSERGDPIEECRIMEGERKEARNELFRKVCSEGYIRYLGRFPHTTQIPTVAMRYEEYHHLLHYAAEAFRSVANAGHSSNLKYSSQFGQNERRRRSPRISKHRRPSVRRDNNSKWILPTANDLHKRGVTFKGHEDFFPRFKPKKYAWWEATLFLPTISYIGDYAEQDWRNMLAWEDKYETTSREKPFTQYACFMDALINTDRDVSYLLKGNHPVIREVGLGDNRAVAALFNSVTTGLNLSSQDNLSSDHDKWAHLVDEINDFYNSRLGRLVGEFIEVHFSRPWLVMSIFAAFVLLLLTSLQTWYTVTSFYHD